MLYEAKVRVAFASSTGERVDIGLEDKGKILVYEIGPDSAKMLTSFSFRRSARKTVRGRPKKNVVCAEPSEVDMPFQPEYDEEVLREKYAALKHVSALVISKDLDSLPALAISEAKIYPIKVEQAEFVGVVIQRLQELLKENKLLWIKRAIDRTICNGLAQ